MVKEMERRSVPCRLLYAENGNAGGKNKQHPSNRVQLQHRFVSSHSILDGTVRSRLTAWDALHLVVMIDMGGEIAPVVTQRLTPRLKAVDRIELVFVPNCLRHKFVGEEHGLAHAVLARAQHLSEAVHAVEGTQNAVLPLESSFAHTLQRRDHKRSIERLRDVQQRQQLLRHHSYASPHTPSITCIDHLDGQIPARRAVLALPVQRVQLHLLEAVLLAELAKHVVVVEEVVVVV